MAGKQKAAKNTKWPVLITAIILIVGLIVLFKKATVEISIWRLISYVAFLGGLLFLYSFFNKKGNTSQKSGPGIWERTKSSISGVMSKISVPSGKTSWYMFLFVLRFAGIFLIGFLVYKFFNWVNNPTLPSFSFKEEYKYVEPRPSSIANVQFSPDDFEKEPSYLFVRTKRCVTYFNPIEPGTYVYYKVVNPKGKSWIVYANYDAVKNDVFTDIIDGSSEFSYGDTLKMHLYKGHNVVKKVVCK